MKNKSKKVAKNWEKTANAFESKDQFLKLAAASRVLELHEQRELLGPSKTKQVSIRLPIEDLEAVKRIAEMTDRPYQQLVVVAIEQYISRMALALKAKT
jgi:predicted DNA binding CopG/RHH family protein